MWLLESAHGSFRYLQGKNKYTIGRKNTDIIISNDDSISRTHAIIEIENNDIYLTDNGSKYGTYIDERELQKSVKTKLQKNVHIKLGLLNSVFQLKVLDLNIATSNIKGNDKQTLYNNLEFLSATRLTTWNRSCTHLVVSELILTAKVLCALTQEQPIVNLKYFDDLVSAVRSSTAPPDHTLYLPELNETLINKNIKMEYKSARKSLFAGKIFVFLTERARSQMAELISLTGGRAIAWERTTLDSGKLKSDAPEYLFIEEPLEGVDQQSQMFLTFQNAVSLLSKQNKRSIPFQEIALAVVHCSCVEHCNPRFNRAALLIPGSTQPAESENILAYDTQHAAGPSKPAQHQCSGTVDDDEPVPRISVPPSYDTDLETMMLSGGSVKRGVDSQSSCSAAKRAKEDRSSTGADFSFRRPASQASSTASGTSKTSMFSFPKPSKTASTVGGSDAADKEELAPLADNPFSRKRKATNKDIGADAPKKSPLENISNTTAVSRKTEERTPREYLSSTRTEPASSGEFNFCKDVSCITKSTAWLGTSTTRLTEENNEADDEPIEVEDYEVRKRNAAFKNSIVIEFMEMPVRRRDLANVTQTDGSKSLRNFKKFKKALIEIQTKIIPESAMEKYVIGTQTRYSDLDEQDGDNEERDEEEEDDDDFGRRPQPVAQKPTKTKRKYLFAM